MSSKVCLYSHVLVCMYVYVCGNTHIWHSKMNVSADCSRVSTCSCACVHGCVCTYSSDLFICVLNTKHRRCENSGRQTIKTVNCFKIMSLPSAGLRNLIGFSITIRVVIVFQCLCQCCHLLNYQCFRRCFCPCICI